MEEKDLISVIVPVYNVEKYLKKCVDSILKQTYKNLEIILVDDGSTDNSGKICDEFKNKNKNVKVIHKKNGGLSDARNEGLKNANGKYIGFVDSDDYIKEDMYEALHDLCNKYGAEISIISYYEVHNNKIVPSKYTGNIYELNKMEAMKELLLDEKIQSYAWNKLFEKKLFNNVNFVKGRDYEDIQIMPLLFEQANKVVLLEQPKYYYVRRKNSILGNINCKLYKDYLNVIYNKYVYLHKKYKELDLYNDYIFVKNMINVYSIIVTYDLDELYPNFEKLYKTVFKEIMNKKEKEIINMLDNYNKAILYMILFDKEITKPAIKQLYKAVYSNNILKSIKKREDVKKCQK